MFAPLTSSLSRHPSLFCVSCRLRTALAAKQRARCRRASVSPSIHRSSPPGTLGFGTATSRPRRVDQTARDLPPQEDFQDPRAERQGVAYADRLLRDGVAREGIDPEKAALMARERFGARLPPGWLSGEAERVYVRLYGVPLRGEGEEGFEGSDGEGEGEVELLREAGDGSGRLEEVEIEAEAEQAREELGAEHEVELEEEGVEGALSTRLVEDDLEAAEMEMVQEEDQAGDSQERAHPLTTANRFGTSPTTLALPLDSIVDPISTQIAGVNNKHLADTAHQRLGGTGLPYGPATPGLAKTMQAKPIQIDAFQHNVSDIEGNVFLATILPGVYASVVSVLTETRKRLGTTWAEGLVAKAAKGELRILDAGGAGAGVFAVREMLRAEWERMHEERSTLDSGMALAEAGGQLGGPGVSPPLGDATVVTGSDVLRRRVSKLLDNTTFVPRLPDYLHTAEQKAKGKFDLVIAPHTLWGGFRFDRERSTHVQNLWSLLDADGGVLCLLEKGVSRGFEVVAGARETLLRTRIKSSGSVGTEFDEDALGAEIQWEGQALAEEEAEAGEEATVTESKREEGVQLTWEKEKGTIIAPCTNHAACPMYRPKGVLKGRRDVCAFEQRYVRPEFLQRILGARDKNFEDVQFSYLSVVRGRDLLEEQGAQQDQEATDAAFAGHEASPRDVSPFILPRAVLPPLKRKGHVLIDLCTPSATLERWTIPRSFGKQAFRDARKSGWGDLWALGAKTRIPRAPKMNLKHGGRLSKAQRAEVKALNVRADPEGNAKAGKGDLTDPRGRRGVGVAGELGNTVLSADEYGRVVVRDVPEESGSAKYAGGPAGGIRIVQSRPDGGKMRAGRKVAGLRDKRDKSGKGNGRRKARQGWED